MDELYIVYIYMYVYLPVPSAGNVADVHPLDLICDIHFLSAIFQAASLSMAVTNITCLA